MKIYDFNTLNPKLGERVRQDEIYIKGVTPKPSHTTASNFQTPEWSWQGYQPMGRLSVPNAIQRTSHSNALPLNLPEWSGNFASMERGSVGNAVARPTGQRIV